MNIMKLINRANHIANDRPVDTVPTFSSPPPGDNPDLLPKNSHRPHRPDILHHRGKRNRIGNHGKPPAHIPGAVRIIYHFQNKCSPVNPAAPIRTPTACACKA